MTKVMWTTRPLICVVVDAEEQATQRYWQAALAKHWMSPADVAGFKKTMKEKGTKCQTST